MRTDGISNGLDFAEDQIKGKFNPSPVTCQNCANESAPKRRTGNSSSNPGFCENVFLKTNSIICFENIVSPLLAIYM